MDVEVELVLACVALDIVDVDMHFGAVADIEEARQSGGDDDQVAHSHVSLSGPNLVFRPGDGGEPHRTVERGQIERDGRIPLAVNLDDAREQRQRLLRRQIAFDAAAVVAAGMDGARRALHAVDQHAPEIADLDRQLALPEEIGAGVRRLEPGQIQNADIDRGDGHPRFFARRKAGEMNGQRHRLARPRERRRVERNIERMRTSIDGEPGQPKRAAGHALGFSIERAMGQRDGVGAGPPVAADRERDNIVSGDKIDIDEALDFIADQRDGRLADEGGGDAQLGLFALRVVRLVERHDHIVGRVGAGRSRPADVERNARLLAVERLDVQSMRAPADAAGKLGGRVSADVDRAARDALRRLDRLVAPAPVGVEPLIVVRDLIERPGRAFARDARAVRRNGDRFERRNVARAQRGVEILLDADRHAFRAHRQHQRALDRASARLADIDDQFRLKRARA